MRLLHTQAYQKFNNCTKLDINILFKLVQINRGLISILYRRCEWFFFSLNQAHVPIMLHHHQFGGWSIQLLCYFRCLHLDHGSGDGGSLHHVFRSHTYTPSCPSLESCLSWEPRNAVLFLTAYFAMLASCPMALHGESPLSWNWYHNFILVVSSCCLLTWQAFEPLCSNGSRVRPSSIFISTSFHHLSCSGSVFFSQWNQLLVSVYRIKNLEFYNRKKIVP